MQYNASPNDSSNDTNNISNSATLAPTSFQQFFDFVKDFRFRTILIVFISFSLCIILSYSLPLYKQDSKTGKIINNAPAKVVGATVLLGTLWFTNHLHMAVSSMIPIFLFPLMEVLSAAEVVSLYINSISMLFLGGFLFAMSMEKWNLHKRLSLWIILKSFNISIRSSPSEKIQIELQKALLRLPLILFGFSITAYLLSMWLSNTATCLIICPNAIGIIKSFEKLIKQNLKKRNVYQRGIEIELVKPFSTGLLYSIAFACNIAGVSTPIGTPGNLITLRYLEMLFPQFPVPTFFEWMLFAVPLSFVFYLFLYLFILAVFVLRAQRNIKKALLEAEGDTSIHTLEEQQEHISKASILLSISESSSNLEKQQQEIELSQQQEEPTPQETTLNTLDNGNMIDLTSFREDYLNMGRITFEEVTIIVLFFILVLLWCFRTGFASIPGWESLFSDKKFASDGSSAILMSFLLFLIPCKNKVPNKSKKEEKKESKENLFILQWEDLQKFPWEIIILFGAGFALAEAFVQSGLSIIIANQLKFFTFLPTILIIALVCTCVTFITEVTSNMSTTQIFLPILGSLAQALNANPLLFMLPGCLSASYSFMMPIATAPNLIITAYGEKRITTLAMACHIGIFLNLFGIALTTLWSYLFVPLIFRTK